VISAGSSLQDLNLYLLAPRSLHLDGAAAMFRVERLGGKSTSQVERAHSGWSAGAGRRG
jgi:hypothetical protein